jgi:hypothetical protein
MTYSEWRKKKSEEESSHSKNPASSSGNTTQRTADVTEKVTSGSYGSNNSVSSYAEWRKRKRSEESVNEWAETSINLVNDIQNRSKHWYDDNEYQSRYNQLTSLLGSADKWRKQYTGNSEAISYIDSIVSALDSVQKYNYNIRKHYSQWETEDDYLKWDAYQTPEGRQKRYSDNQKQISALQEEKKNMVGGGNALWRLALVGAGAIDADTYLEDDSRL